MIVKRFPFPLSAPALFRQTLSSLTSALQRLAPTEKAVPLIATQMFSPDQGLNALLGFL